MRFDFTLCQLPKSKVNQGKSPWTDSFYYLLFIVLFQMSSWIIKKKKKDKKYQYSNWVQTGALLNSIKQIIFTFLIIQEE